MAQMGIWRTKEKMKYQKNGKYKKVIISFPANVPRRLVFAYKKIVKQYKDKGGYQRKLARLLDVNDFYLNQLLIKGIEPTDKTLHGQETRLKLFLPRKKKVIRVQSDKPKQTKPDFIVAWHHLPTEERQKVIKEYLKWKENN